MPALENIEYLEATYIYMMLRCLGGVTVYETGYCYMLNTFNGRCLMTFLDIVPHANLW